MKKIVLIVVVLLALSVVPSSLTSSNVWAQVDEAEPTASDNVCLYEDLRYSTGSYIWIALNDGNGLLLRCTRTEGVLRWEPRKQSEVAQYLLGAE